MRKGGAGTPSAAGGWWSPGESEREGAKKGREEGEAWGGGQKEGKEGAGREREEGGGRGAEVLHVAVCQVGRGAAQQPAPAGHPPIRMHHPHRVVSAQACCPPLTCMPTHISRGTLPLMHQTPVLLLLPSPTHPPTTRHHTTPYHRPTHLHAQALPIAVGGRQGPCRVRAQLAVAGDCQQAAQAQHSVDLKRVKGAQGALVASHHTAAARMPLERRLWCSSSRYTAHRTQHARQGCQHSTAACVKTAQHSTTQRRHTRVWPLLLLSTSADAARTGYIYGRPRRVVDVQQLHKRHCPVSPVPAAVLRLRQTQSCPGCSGPPPCGSEGTAPSRHAPSRARQPCSSTTQPRWEEGHRGR